MDAIQRAGKLQYVDQGPEAQCETGKLGGREVKKCPSQNLLSDMSGKKVPYAFIARQVTPVYKTKEKFLKALDESFTAIENNSIPDRWPDARAFNMMHVTDIDYHIPLSSHGLFGLIDKEFASRLAPFLKQKRSLLVMEGKGFLAKALSEEGCQVVATDIDPSGSVYPVNAEDAEMAIFHRKDNYDAIVVSWPWPSKRMVALMKVYPKSKDLIYIGPDFKDTDKIAAPPHIVSEIDRSATVKIEMSSRYDYKEYCWIVPGSDRKGSGLVGRFGNPIDLGLIIKAIKDGDFCYSEFVSLLPVVEKEDGKQLIDHCLSTDVFKNKYTGSGCPVTYFRKIFNNNYQRLKVISYVMKYDGGCFFDRFSVDYHSGAIDINYSPPRNGNGSIVNSASGSGGEQNELISRKLFSISTRWYEKMCDVIDQEMIDFIARKYSKSSSN